MFQVNSLGFKPTDHLCGPARDFHVCEDKVFRIEEIKDFHQFQSFATKASVDYREGSVKGDIIAVVHPAPSIYPEDPTFGLPRESLHYHYQRNPETGLFRIIDQPKVR